MRDNAQTVNASTEACMAVVNAYLSCYRTSHLLYTSTSSVLTPGFTQSFTDHTSYVAKLTLSLPHCFKSYLTIPLLHLRICHTSPSHISLHGYTSLFTFSPHSTSSFAPLPINVLSFHFIHVSSSLCMHTQCTLLMSSSSHLSWLPSLRLPPQVTLVSPSSHPPPHITLVSSSSILKSLFLCYPPHSTHVTFFTSPSSINCKSFSSHLLPCVNILMSSSSYFTRLTMPFYVTLFVSSSLTFPSLHHCLHVIVSISLHPPLLFLIT